MQLDSVREKLMNQRKGQVRNVSDLQTFAVVFVSMAIIVAIGVAVLGQMRPQTFTNLQVNDESFQPANATGSSGMPSNGAILNLAQVGQGVVSGSETVVFYDSSANSNTTLTKGSNYTVPSYDNGEINVTTVPQYEDGFSTNNDQFFVDYTNKTANAGTNAVDSAISAFKTMGDFFVVIVIMAVAAVMFVLLQVVRRVGRNAQV